MIVGVFDRVRHLPSVICQILLARTNLYSLHADNYIEKRLLERSTVTTVDLFVDLQRSLPIIIFPSRTSLSTSRNNISSMQNGGLDGKPERIEILDDSKSPIVAICWLPRIIQQIIQPGYHLNDYGRKDQEQGRYMMIVLSLIIAVYVYWWCKGLYGKKGWWLPLLLLLFDPLYLAYSTIISTDLACGTFLVALLYHYRKYLVHQERKHFYIAALFAGVGIVTKQTMLFSMVLLPVLAAYFFLQHRLKHLVSWRALFKTCCFCLSFL